MKIKEIEFTAKPCGDAVEWLRKQPSAQTAWDVCERGDWMWWALCNIPGALPTKKIRVQYACWCARRVKNYTAACTASALLFTSLAYYTLLTTGFATERKLQADWIRKHVPFPLETK